MKIKNINQIEERQIIEKYCLKVGGYILEHPIKSVNPEIGISPADAIININGKKEWLELTTISRHIEMRKQIGDLRKHPEKYKGQSFIPGISPAKFESLPLKIYEAIIKKMNKNYSCMSSLLGKKGILLICFVNNDPFFDIDNWRNLIGILKDHHIQCSWLVNVKNKYFKEIVFGAYVMQKGWMFETVFYRKILKKLKIGEIEN